MPLKSRSTFPPGGWYIFLPLSKWPAGDPKAFFAGKTFDEVARMMLAHMQANPRVYKEPGLDQCISQLDNYTCIRLKNDPNYCLGGPLPKARSLLTPSLGSAGVLRGLAQSAGAVAEKAQKLYSGIGVLFDWIGSGGHVVEQSTAEARAKVCAVCVKNRVGGSLDSYFTRPSAERIRSHLAVKNEMELKTIFDERLNICEACACVTSLKVWVPLPHITERLKPEMREALDPRCWILMEEKATTL